MFKHPPQHSGRPPTAAARAFTIIELLIAIVIVSILAAILIAIVPGFHNKADTVSCAQQLKQVGTFMRLYAAEHQNRFPPIRPDNSAGNQDRYWRRAILPYMDLPSMGDSIYQSKLTCPVVRRRIVALRARPDICSFGVNIYLSEPENNRMTKGININSLRHPSKTLMATESYLQNAGTPAPNLQQSDFRNVSYDIHWNPHHGAQNILYCDGHVEPFAQIQQIGAPPYNPNSPSDIWTP